MAVNTFLQVGEFRDVKPDRLFGISLQQLCENLAFHLLRFHMSGLNLLCLVPEIILEKAEQPGTRNAPHHPVNGFAPP
jgi:hypothetical protein